MIRRMATDPTVTPAPESGTSGRAGRAVAPLPERAVLVHIGPHKTGTTTIQAAFHASRESLAAQDVVYAGGGRRPILPVLALRRARGKRAAVPDLRHWSGLVDEARAAAGRVVISNEAFADASRRAIGRLASDLGRDRIHIVATLRSFAAILPSQWQQFVKGGLTLSFDDWLRDVIEPDERARRKVFWRRHQHHQLVARWADAVGPDRVTVIVLDEDPLRLPRLFEGLLALRDGTLADHAAVRNRSLTWPEAEAVRAVNQAFRTADYPADLQTRLVARGVCPRLLRREPDPAEPRIQLPAWAVERVAMVGREIVAGLVDSHVRIIGDLDRLLTIAQPHPSGTEAPTRLSADLAGALAMAAVDTLSAMDGRSRRMSPGELDGIPSRRLAGALAHRLVEVPRAGWRSIRGGTSAS
jgi:hypothetical protein